MADGLFDIWGNLMPSDNIIWSDLLPSGPIDLGGDFSLFGEPLATSSLLAMGTDPNQFGLDFSLGVPGIDDQPMRPSVFDVSGTPLGFRNLDTGALETWGGQPVAADPFGIRTGPPDDPFNFRSGISTPMSAGRVLQDALRGLTRGSGGGGDGDGGGTRLGVSIPTINAPGAADIPPLQVPSVPPASLVSPTITTVERTPIPLPREGPEPLPYFDPAGLGLRRAFRRGGF